ncbi:MAG TPA: terminase TerL endonuclease subunit [Burkholderiales bacterium]|nr:terminase TerL endonuclease subunit [Burkholderiales bacterium]
MARFENEPEYPFAWAPEKAARICSYIERLRHVKGKWGGEPIKLEPAQKFGLACVFGWVRKSDGMRRFRTVYEEVPRKNAKTTKLAGVGAYMLTADNEWGAEVYSAATTQDQARIVFDIAQQMARMDGEFRAHWGVNVLTRSLSVPETASKFLPLSAEGSTLDGLNVSCALIDELHAHKTRTVHDVLDSGTGSRAQPLIWKITTAGSNRAGVCYDQREYLTKILNAVLKRHGGMGYRVEGNSHDDDAFWGIIYTIDEGDDPFDEKTWRKANPLYGVSVEPDDMQRMASVAKVQAAALSEFLTKRLNVWVNADAAWMNMMQWDACADHELKIERFAGKRCIAALDAAFKKDLFAKVRVFVEDGHYYVFGRYYMPHVLVERKGFEQLAGWVRSGWIRTTEGNTLDIEAVRQELIEDQAAFDLAEVPYDPAQLTQFATEMLQQGMPMVELRPLVPTFSPAMKELEELVTSKRLTHNGDPVLAWMIANVVCHHDAKDNIYPRKESPDKKIDGAIALIMAIARAMHSTESVYESRGVLVI